MQRFFCHFHFSTSSYEQRKQEQRLETGAPCSPDQVAEHFVGRPRLDADQRRDLVQGRAVEVDAEANDHRVALRQVGACMG